MLTNVGPGEKRENDTKIRQKKRKEGGERKKKKKKGEKERKKGEEREQHDGRAWIHHLHLQIEGTKEPRNFVNRVGCGMFGLKMA